MTHKVIGIKYSRGATKQIKDGGPALAPDAVHEMFPNEEWTFVTPDGINFEEYINKDAMLNYVVMIYWINGTDNLSRNMAIVTYDGKVWYPTLYDLDGTFGINPYGGETTKFIENLEEEYSLLFSRTSTLFKKEIAERYFELRKDILTIENTINKFEGIYNQIPEEYIQKEKEKWNNPNQSDINQVREYLEKRVQYLDEFMGENLKH